MLTGDMLRRAAARFGDKPAIIDGPRQITYGALDAAANRLAHALIARGITKGRHIAILSRNRLEYGVAFFGVARSGAVLVNVSVLYPADELRWVLEQSDAMALLYDPAFEDRVAEARGHLPDLELCIALDDSAQMDGAVTLDALCDGAPETPPAIDIHPDDPFCMTYTGGTTGRPKGVLCSHRNRAVTAHTVMHEEQITECDVVGIMTPMFHVAALNIMFQPAVLAGATVTMLGKWDVGDFVQMVQDTGMTAGFMVPTQIAMLMQTEDLPVGALTSWRKIAFAGAPMPDWVQRAMGERLPDVALYQIYGQSELGVIAALRPWDLDAHFGAVGRQPYNVDVAVVDRDGQPVATGEIGEVVSRGDNVMLGYYGQPEQTAEFFRLGDGWGWSGDLATMDADGFITLVDRSKDMIISGGENIYPKEIEVALYDHPAVAECAVFGIPDPKWGEVPAAYVLLRDGATTGTEALDAHCADRLARFKRPRLIKFVTEFPKTPIGKIQKNLLRDPYWKDLEKKI